MTPRHETSGKRVRAVCAGLVVADTLRAELVWEFPYFPVYYVPRVDLDAELLDTGELVDLPGGWRGRVHDVVLGDRTVVPGGATLLHSHRSDGTPIDDDSLADLVRLQWGAMDEWLEEDEPVYVHPRDPYKRIDALPSSRRVEISVDGVLLAESRRPVRLFETGIAARTYVPLMDVRTDLLVPSDSTTRCPYKGEATYWSVQLPGGRLLEDLVWCYRFPLPESIRIAGLVAFYDERVQLALDGVVQEWPGFPG